MIQVNEIMHLSLFKNFSIIAGENYVSNNVNATVILEYESSRIHYKGYGPGYFVLLSYFMASVNPELVHDTLKTLIQKQVSAIAIKKMPDEEIPEELIRLANEKHVVLLTFYEEFMEDLIICVNESMKTRSQYIINEEKLHNVLNRIGDLEFARKTALEINNHFKPYLLAACLTPKDLESNLAVHTFFDKLMYRQFRKNLSSDQPYTFVKLDSNLILLSSFEKEDAERTLKKQMAYIRMLLLDIGMDLENFFVGVCSEAVEIKHISRVIVQAQTAASVCRLEGKDHMHYTETGIYKFMLPVILNPLYRNELREQINKISQYDDKHESMLMKTVMTFTKNDRDYASTSEECFQHINTIRYRIKKAKELLNVESDDELVFITKCNMLLEGMGNKD